MQTLRLFAGFAAISISAAGSIVAQAPKSVSQPAPAAAATQDAVAPIAHPEAHQLDAASLEGWRSKFTDGFGFRFGELCLAMARRTDSNRHRNIPTQYPWREYGRMTSVKTISTFGVCLIHAESLSYNHAIGINSSNAS